MRYLAIDLGNRRTGLAICDPSETIVSPLTMIDDRSRLVEKVAEIIKTENVEAVIIGLPLNMDDSEGPQAKKSKEFAKTLEAKIDIPIHFQDERLSTFAAEEKLAPAEYTRGKKKKRIDAVAAAQILEFFLEQKKN
ncbi:Holliday junction resolvase RuvX [Planctomycetota bacterium]